MSVEKSKLRPHLLEDDAALRFERSKQLIVDTSQAVKDTMRLIEKFKALICEVSRRFDHQCNLKLLADNISLGRHLFVEVCTPRTPVRERPAGAVI
jgi:hypothetical protein